MSGKTSSAQVSAFGARFYGESPPKRSRIHDSASIKPPFKLLKEKISEFDKKLSEPDNKEVAELKKGQEEIGDEPKNLDRDSPLPLKNLGNTCYENSIIQCLFSLNMFMDNFKNSMAKMRQYVVKPTIKTYEVAKPDTSEQQQQQQQQRDSLVISATTKIEITIVENDVRYRIADAFDKLYKSYTQKIFQVEETNHKSTSNSHQTNTNCTERIQTDYAISQSDAAIPLCKPHTGTSVTQTSNSENTQVATLTGTSSLTPIALVSSAAQNEQSEIENRLEDLKSAVGERSSQFNSTHQQDASEFFYHVIDSIQEFYQSLGKSDDDDNPVTKAFELELDYLIRCPKCHHRIMSEPEKIRTLPLALPHVNNECSAVNREECTHPANNAPTPPTSDLGLDSPGSLTPDEDPNPEEKENQALVDEIVPEDNSTNTMSIAKLELTDKSESKSQQKQYTLCDALNNYFKDDLLEYSCSQVDCDSKQRTKKCLIRKLPQVLFITLARYSYTGKKNLDEIEAPFELSVPFRENKSPSHSPSAHLAFDEDDTYQLVAVVCHLGSSLNAGHYTSYVYNQNNFSWYSCDDDSITKVQEDDVKNDVRKTGYCFFYAHKSCVNRKQQEDNQIHVETNVKHQLGQDEKLSNEVPPDVVCSSVILTPDSSPKSSPTPSISSQEDRTRHDRHSRCQGETASMDDWS